MNLRNGLLLVAPFLFIVCVVSLAFAITIEEIQAAIEAAGAEWTAGDNPVWRMHRDFGWYKPIYVIPTWTGLEDRYIPSGHKNLPSQLDWRNVEGQNWVTDIKDQEDCGACWTFAANAAIETQVAYAEGWPNPTIDLSEQHILSCAISLGCDYGGLLTTAFNFAQNVGVTDEACFPYEAWEEPCSDICSDWRDRITQIHSWSVVGDGGMVAAPEEIMDALQHGPVGTTMLIYEDFLSYTEGIYSTVIGLPEGFHTPTIIGHDATERIWICKNSWSDAWGEEGYFRIRWGAAAIGMWTVLPQYKEEPVDDDSADDDSTDDDSGDDDSDDDDSADDDSSDDDAEDDDSNDDDIDDDNDDTDGGDDAVQDDDSAPWQPDQEHKDSPQSCGC